MVKNMLKVSMPILLVCCFGKATYAAEKIIVGGVGADYLLELPAIAKSIDIDQSSIIDVSRTETKAKLLIKGRKIGETSLTVTLVDGSELSFLVEVGSRLGELRKALLKIPGLKVTEEKSRVIAKGSVDNKESLLRLQELKMQFGSLLQDETESNLASESSVVRTINRVLRDNDLQNFEAHAYGRIIALEGSPKDPPQAELALRIARMISGDVENRISMSLNGAPAVAIEVLFVELTKSDAMDIGFQPKFASEPELPTAGSIAGGTAKAVRKSFKSGVFDLNWQVGGLSNFLQLIQSKSSSRVLSNPKLVARSGTAAKFHAGNTVYLTMKRTAQNEVIQEYVPVEAGIVLSITPKIDDVGQIDSSISTEVSEFSDIKNDANPSLSKSSVQTAVTIRDGQTIMLSGLVRRKNVKTVDRVPLLADIPLAGEFFKSRKSLDSETEMLVLVTMNRIKAFDDQAKAAGEKLWNKGADDVSFRIFD